MTQNYRFAEKSALYMLKISGSLKPALFIAIFFMDRLKSSLFPVKNLMSATIFVLDCTLINTVHLSPSDSTVSEDAGIEPRTLTMAVTVRGSNSLKDYPEYLPLHWY
jgi:ABC-type transport system involved in cytochrome c biogenesis permease subunit